VDDGGTVVVGFDPLFRCAYSNGVNRVVSSTQDDTLVGRPTFERIDGAISPVQAASTPV
jgi:hypothetical protein